MRVLSAVEATAIGKTTGGDNAFQDAWTEQGDVHRSIGEKARLQATEYSY